MNTETNEELSAEDTAIDDLFDGETEEGDESEVAEETGETEETEESISTTDEDQETADQVEASQESDEKPDISDEPEEPTLVPIAALHDERRKREALTKENEDLKGQLPQDELDAPDMYDDPEGYKRWVREQVRTEDLNERISTSRAQMLEAEEDYGVMEQTFMILAGKDSTLIDKMQASPEPAKFAYDTAKEFANTERQKLKDEVRKELLAEQGKSDPDPELTEEQKRNKSAVETPNLATAAATEKNTVHVESDEGLDEVFADIKY